MNNRPLILCGRRTTPDINLVAALVAMGFDAETGATQSGEDHVSRVFVISANSRDGRHNVHDLLAAWREGEPWVRKNPEHPFAYLMMGMRIRKELLEGIKTDAPMISVRQEDSLALLKPNCSKETERNILGRMGA